MFPSFDKLVGHFKRNGLQFSKVYLKKADKPSPETDQSFFIEKVDDSQVWIRDFGVVTKTDLDKSGAFHNKFYLARGLEAFLNAVCPENDVQKVKAQLSLFWEVFDLSVVSESALTIAALGAPTTGAKKDVEREFSAFQHLIYHLMRAYDNAPPIKTTDEGDYAVTTGFGVDISWTTTALEHFDRALDGKYVLNTQNVDAFNTSQGLLLDANFAWVTKSFLLPLDVGEIEIPKVNLMEKWIESVSPVGATIKADKSMMLQRSCDTHEYDEEREILSQHDQWMLTHADGADVRGSPEDVVKEMIANSTTVTLVPNVKLVPQLFEANDQNNDRYAELFEILKQATKDQFGKFDPAMCLTPATSDNLRLRQHLLICDGFDLNQLNPRAKMLQDKDVMRPREDNNHSCEVSLRAVCLDPHTHVQVVEQCQDGFSYLWTVGFFPNNKAHGDSVWEYMGAFEGIVGSAADADRGLVRRKFLDFVAKSAMGTTETKNPVMTNFTKAVKLTVDKVQALINQVQEFSIHPPSYSFVWGTPRVGQNTFQCTSFAVFLLSKIGIVLKYDVGVGSVQEKGLFQSFGVKNLRIVMTSEELDSLKVSIGKKEGKDAYQFSWTYTPTTSTVPITVETDPLRFSELRAINNKHYKFVGFPSIGMGDLVDIRAGWLKSWFKDVLIHDSAEHFTTHVLN